jgi:hypothetical protein
MNDKIVTLTYDTCAIIPRCTGCYIEYLKSNPSSTKNGSSLDKILDRLRKGEINVLNVNISSSKDITTFLNDISVINTENVLIRIIIPTVLIKSLIVNKNLLASYKNLIVCVTINTFVELHMDNIDKVKLIGNINLPIEYEISTNSKTIYNYEYIKKIMITALNIEPNEIVINYIHTSDYNAEGNKITSKDIFLQMIKIKKHICMVSNMDPDAVNISPCIEAGIELHDKPCESADIYDYINYKIGNIGCPFKEKPCLL